MDVAQIVKSTQEQGVAAWVDYLNQLRLNELLAKLTSQNMNLEQALAELQKMKVNIAALIENNRAAQKECMALSQRLRRLALKTHVT